MVRLWGWVRVRVSVRVILGDFSLVPEHGAPHHKLPHTTRDTSHHTTLPHTTRDTPHYV